MDPDPQHTTMTVIGGVPFTLNLRANASFFGDAISTPGGREDYHLWVDFTVPIPGARIEEVPEPAVLSTVLAGLLLISVGGVLRARGQDGHLRHRPTAAPKLLSLARAWSRFFERLVVRPA